MGTLIDQVKWKDTYITKAMIQKIYTHEQHTRIFFNEKYTAPLKNNIEYLFWVRIRWELPSIEARLQFLNFVWRRRASNTIDVNDVDVDGKG